MENNLNYYITKYFNDYLPNVTGASKNTILSYKDTFVSLLQYLKSIKHYDINKLKLDSIDFVAIEDYLKYLENQNKNSISTRNQRLSAIHSFYKYLQKRELSCFDTCSKILSIPTKKAPTSTISYFSKNEIEILINVPNIKTRYGFRDYTLLMFMYETATRASEISNLTKKQVFLSENSYVIVLGKGNKERRIPITENLSKIIKKYFTSFNKNDDDFVFTNKSDEKITPKGIEYILKKYVDQARKKNSDKFKGKYSNHSMRHTRAMHLLESGVNLVYIRDFLGHTSITTTEIYAKTNPKIKEEQIIKHSNSLNVNKKYSESEKNDLLNFLKTMK